MAAICRQIWESECLRRRLPFVRSTGSLPIPMLKARRAAGPGSKASSKAIKIQIKAKPASRPHTNSTIWLEAMPIPPFIDAAVHRAESSLPDGDFDRSCLALLHQLETSLQASQRALLCGDVAGVELGTVEQRRLQAALEPLWRRNRNHLRSDGLQEQDAPSRSIPESATELADELRAALIRVLHLGRVQAILLGRAQRSLVVLGNLLAGAGANYGPAARTAWVPIDPAS